MVLTPGVNVLTPGLKPYIPQGIFLKSSGVNVLTPGVKPSQSLTLRNFLF